MAMAEDSLDRQLKYAIANKRLIRFRYSGVLRIAEPHDFGSQKGRVRLLVHQLHSLGGASANAANGWRLLDVAKIEDLDILNDQFPGSRGQAYEQHHEWDVVYARVS
jgi:hypothetical protein